MKNIILLFLFLIPAFFFAQYPATGNKSRLGYQTTGDGLIWRGVAADTAIKPRTTANAYFQLDTVNGVLRRYIATQGSWQVVAVTPNLTPYALKTYVDSLYATDHDRDSTNELQTLTFASPLLGISDGNNVDLSPILTGYVTGSGTNNRVPKWSATSNLTDSNIQDDGTAVSILSSKPFSFGTWTLAGRPTGTANYFGWRDGTTLEWYNGTRWAYALESTFARGTADYVPIFNSTNQVTESQYFRYLTSTNVLNIGNGNIKITTSNPGALTSLLVGTGTVGTQALNLMAASVGNSAVGIGRSITVGNSAFGVGTGLTIANFAFGFGTDVVVSGAGIGIGQAIRVNHNNSIAIGRASTTTATNQLVIGAGGGNAAIISDVYFGSGVQRGNPFDATPAAGSDYTINGSGALGTNFAGGNLTLAGGKPTGSGLAGDVIFSTSASGATGSTLRSLTQRWWVKGNTGFFGNTSTPSEDFDVNGDGRVRDSLRIGTTPSHSAITGILTRDANGWIGSASVSGIGYSGGVLTAQNFANTNLTATGNRVHDWANYNFTWTNMKKFMWGADSLFYITKEFPGYTYAAIRNPSGQSLLDLQGDDDGGTNSSEIRLTDTETGNIVFIVHDDRGFGSDGFRLEHYNGSNYHNMLYVNKISRLFHINQTGRSSGTMYEANATLANGLSKNIIRGGVGVFGTDSVSATHFFRVTNNQTKNKDVFGIYSQNGAVDTMYFRLDKVGRMFQYKPSFFSNLVTFSDYGTNATTAATLGKTESGYVASFATNGAVLSKPDNTERYNTVTSTTSPVTLSNTVSDNLINQGSTQATFTLNFPASPVDGQVLKITYNNAITTLTLDGNGNTIVGSAVTTGVAGSQRAFKFYTGIGWIKLY